LAEGRRSALHLAEAIASQLVDLSLKRAAISTVDFGEFAPIKTVKALWQTSQFRSVAVECSLATMRK
jgi:hypothetical protein